MGLLQATKSANRLSALASSALTVWSPVALGGLKCGECHFPEFWRPRIVENAISEIAADYEAHFAEGAAAFLAGANCYLAKPVNTRDLPEKMAAAGERKSRSPDAL